MISKQLYKSFVFFNENKGSLYLEVEKIYKRFQQLRLEITGASWTLKSDKIYDVLGYQVFFVCDVARRADRPLGADEINVGLRQIQPRAGRKRLDGRRSRPADSGSSRLDGHAHRGSARPPERPLRSNQKGVVPILRQLSWPKHRGGRRGGPRVRPRTATQGSLRHAEPADGPGADHPVFQHGLLDHFAARLFLGHDAYHAAHHHWAVHHHHLVPTHHPAGGIQRQQPRQAAVVPPRPRARNRRRKNRAGADAARAAD